MEDALPAPHWECVDSKVCMCGMHNMVWEITTFIPDTVPVRLAVCPSCDLLLPVT